MNGKHLNWDETQFMEFSEHIINQNDASSVVTRHN
jgi:hypothetical protein